MNKLIAYMALPALLFASCTKAPELDEVEAGFAERGALPEVSIDPSSVVVDEYAQTLTVNVSFKGVSADMDSLELGLLSAEDAGFVESYASLLETPEDGTYTMSVHVTAGITNYVKAMAATTDGAVYSDRITVSVPDIPWYYKIAGEYVGTFGPDANFAGSGATPFENHVVKVEVADDFSTVTLYDLDPFIKNSLADDYVSGEMNYVTGTLDLEARTITFPSNGSAGTTVGVPGYEIVPISSYSEDGYGLASAFVCTFSEDASELYLPWYGVLDLQENLLSYVYSEDGITLSAN